MAQNSSIARRYPKSHILAAGGVAVLVISSFLIFPSSDVEAQRTALNLELSQNSEPAMDLDDVLPETSLSGIANTSLDGESVTTIEEEETVPELPQSQVVTVKSGDTLSTIFESVGLPASELHEVLGSAKEARKFTNLKVGQELNFSFDETGQLTQLETALNSLESMRLERADEGFSFHHDKIKPDVQTTYAHGKIDSSLFLAAQNAGLSHKLTMDLANIFNYDIDFALDIREGDEFELIYEEKTVDGKRVGTGNILSARFTNKGKTYTAVRYKNSQGSTTYYTADGKSMRKAFIRTPVDFARISSRFSNGRKHPILNKIRAHRGVDYAAPRGTPIKAAGDGKVVLAGRHGGYGNTVILQHGNKYRTLYAHMNGFAKGIRSGGTVKQGQIIGYIGTTGLSTGPHLHYEFQVNGVHVDPLSQKLPMADPLSGKEKTRFMALSKPLMARMDQEKSVMLATAAAGSSQQ